MHLRGIGHPGCQKEIYSSEYFEGKLTPNLKTPSNHGYASDTSPYFSLNTFYFTHIRVSA